MNRPSTEPHPAPQTPNPFLAAAAAMPPPPGPVLPPLHKSTAIQVEPRPDGPSPFRQEFPYSGTGAPDPENPTPWTLPSMPQPPLPGSSAMMAAASPAAPVRGAALAPGLVKALISTLEDGRRALTDTFQSLIEKLEATLTAPSPAPAASVPLPAPPVMPTREPAIPPQVELPSLLARPEPITPGEKTNRVLLPSAAPAAPPPALPPAPVTIPVPSPAAQEKAPAPAAPRRKFARPSGLAAQQLSTTLHQVFETSPAASNGGGYGAPPVPLPPRAPVADSPFHAVTAIPAPPLPPPPAPRPQAHGPDSVYSPFAVSGAPLSSPGGMPAEPVPFTFLANNGNQFEPAPVSGPPGTYDSLDDTALPWMQPLSGSAPRH